MVRNQQIIKRSIPLFFLILLLFSCERPKDAIIESVDRTNMILVNNDWHLRSFEMKTENKDIPPPLLFNPIELELDAGIYDLDDMVFDASDMMEYRVDFKENREIHTIKEEIDLLIEKAGSYFVLNDRRIRIKSEQSLYYTYFYNEENGQISLSADRETASKIINKTNQKLIDAISKSTPSKIGDALAGILFNNEALQELINSVVVDAISGKLEFINEIDPDQVAQELAQIILEELESIDWEPFIYNLIYNQLEGISGIDAEAVAQLVSQEIVNYIQGTLNAENIYDLIFPYINEIPANSEQITESVALLVVDVFTQVFNENNLQPIIRNAWESYTELSEEQISLIADSLTSALESVYFNPENISQLVLPFAELIDETPLFQLGELAASTTEAIENLVNQVNILFPDLGLDPDYESMQNAIRLAYIGIKPIISIIGPEEAANQVAELILSQFLSTENIKAFFVLALEYLQNIDPEDAAEVLVTWLLTLEDDIANALYLFIDEKLGPILDNLDPNATAQLIAEGIENYILENITQESVFEIILPIFESLSDLSAEVVAEYLTGLIIDLEIIEDTITEENLVSVLLPVLESLQQTNVEEIVQNLVTALVNSDVFQDNITEERVSLILSLLIYKSYWEDVQIANNFIELTITLEHD